MIRGREPRLHPDHPQWLFDSTAPWPRRPQNVRCQVRARFRTRPGRAASFGGGCRTSIHPLMTIPPPRSCLTSPSTRSYHGESAAPGKLFDRGVEARATRHLTIPAVGARRAILKSTGGNGNCVFSIASRAAGTSLRRSVWATYTTVGRRDRTERPRAGVRAAEPSIRWQPFNEER